MANPTMTFGRPGVKVVKFGASEPLKIISPVWSSVHSLLMERWDKAASSRPDVIEWRVDRSEISPTAPSFTDLEAHAAYCRELYGIAVLATYRSAETEPEYSDFSRLGQEYKDTLLRLAAWADVVDVEVGTPETGSLVSEIKKRGAAVLLSEHLESPCSIAHLEELAHSAKESQVNGLKVAFQVRNDDDLVMLRGAQEWALEAPLPTAVFGMGERAIPTRVGDLARKAPFAFAVAPGLSHSAIGQPTAERLRAALD